MRCLLVTAVLCAGCGVGQESPNNKKQFKPLNIDLGPTSLSVEAALVLAQHKGYLSLDHVTTISDEAAKVLAQHKGYLSLKGLTTLSDDVANALSQHEGGLSLDGLTALSDEAAKALRANPKIFLPRKFRR